MVRSFYCCSDLIPKFHCKYSFSRQVNQISELSVSFNEAGSIFKSGTVFWSSNTHPLFSQPQTTASLKAAWSSGTHKFISFVFTFIKGLLNGQFIVSLCHSCILGFWMLYHFDCIWFKEFIAGSSVTVQLTFLLCCCVRLSVVQARGYQKSWWSVDEQQFLLENIHRQTIFFILSFW